MKKLGLLIVFLSSLHAFSLDGMIDSISNNVGDAISNKATKSIDDFGNEEDEKGSQPETKEAKLKKLKELVKMRENGYITKEEYMEEKRKILSK